MEQLADSKKFSLMDLFDILVVAQKQVSCAPWGVITIADEHYRTEVTLRAIEALSKKFPPPQGKSKGSALVANFLDREHHTVGVKMFAELLKANGWKVDFFATPLHIESLFDHIQKSSNYNLICCALTMEFNLQEIARILKTLRTNANTRESVIVVGSPLFSEKRFIDKVTDEGTGKPLADLLAKNFMDGLEFIGNSKRLQGTVKGRNN